MPFQTIGNYLLIDFIYVNAHQSQVSIADSSKTC